MRIISPYTYPHNWLKGNFHTHTTNSDGKASREDVIAMYRDDNYDFLAVTDHRKYWSPDRERDGGMLLIAGEEVHVTDGEGRATDAHVVSLGASAHVDDRRPMQALIDAVNAAGGLAIVAHPRWTWMTYAEFESLERYAAFEVWNGGCADVDRADSSDYWDWHLTKLRRPLWGVGSDDMHKPEHDFGMGWTWVNAEKSIPAILDALRRGDFYASSGPRIETIRTDGEAIRLHTSGAKTIKFMGSEGNVLKWVDGKNVKFAEYVPTGKEPYIRAQVHGHDGTVAWTNPFFVEA